MKTVMFVSSAGGHLSELLKISPLFSKYNSIIITEKTKSTEYLKEKFNKEYSVEYMYYGSRFYPFKYVFVFTANVFLSFKYILKYRPSTLVTTGAHTGGIMAFIAKLFKTKVIYIESLAKVKEISKTGKNIYKIADKFYVQWEELSLKYEKAEYLGRLV